jgi:hypothetical protein
MKHPTDISLDTLNVDENVSSGTTVGSLSSTDQDSGDTFTYTLVSGDGDTDNASFAISGADLNTNTTLDYETKNSYSIRVRTTDNSGSIYEKSFTITVNDLNEIITVMISDYTKVYDKNFIDTSNLSFTVNGLLNGDSEEDLGTPVYTITGTATNTVGTYSITLSGLGNSSYNSIDIIGGNATITPATLTITADTLSKTYGDTDPELTHTTIGLISGDTFTGTLTRTVGEDVGTYTISNDNLTYGNNYTENFVSSTYTINKLPVTVVADTQTKTFGDTDPDFTFTATPDEQSSLSSDDITFTGALSRTTGQEDVGSYPIGIGTLTNTNFSVTYTPSNLTITAKPITIIPTSGQSKTYGTVDPALSYTISPTALPDGTTITLGGLLSRTQGDTAGTYSITIGTVSDTNYDITLSPETFEITNKTITVSGITASDKVYDGTTEATLDTSGITFTGLEAGETITATVTGTFDSKNIGASKTVSLTTSYSGSTVDNYTIVDQSSTTASITARTVSVTGKTDINKTFDDTTNLPVGETGYGVLTGVLPGEDVSLIGAAVYNAATSGSRIIEIGTTALSGADKDNYILNWTNGSGTIAKKTLTVTANNDAKFVTEGDASGYNGVSYTGFEGDDDVNSAITTLASVSRSNSGTNTAGSYPGTLVPSGVVATNYDISYVNGDYTIIPADKLLLKVTNQTTTYGSGGYLCYY